MRRIRAIMLGLSGLSAVAICASQASVKPSRWAQPAADLAGQVSDILGPGQVQLTIRNLSTIETGEIPAIRKSLEQDLNSHGVLTSGAESANLIRVTLSENARERLWVAEVVEGHVTHVAMVHVELSAERVAAADSRLVLRKEKVAGLFNRIGGTAQDNPILAFAQINGHLVVIFADRISIFSSGVSGWAEVNAFPLNRKLPRDPRAILMANADGGSFTAYIPGGQCTGNYSLPLAGATADSGWSVRCHASDDPWPIYQSADASSATALKAFYNPARDYFTGVVTPAIGVDLPAFYSAGMIPRAAGGAALLVAGIDGKVSIVENGALRAVAGTRDWGSDFAVVRSGCGAGTQVISSSSGEAANDSLRAFDIPALEAIAVSGPLALDGAVTALWTAADGKSALAVVRNASNQYEVDRVTALCN
ncbi:hypothetical protein P8935_00345 [Telmatobacter sp. DSM 110680]|uniref:Uncharacterized protein n=1 Tax=Telmatobacter sp. DSM 110680 TaxID=3036704 RepID=A0AAU7DI73_9BACT